MPRFSVAARSASGPIGEAGHVDEEDERDVEVVAHVDEVRLLLRPVAVERAAVGERVVGDHADGVPVDTREGGDQAEAVVRLDLEDRALIERRAQNAVHGVGAAAVTRHDVAEAGGVGRGVVELGHGRQLVDVRGHVGEERLDLPEGVLLVGRLVVDAAGLADVDLRAAELARGEILAHRAAHDGWPGREDGRGLLGHHAPVHELRASGGAAGGEAEHGADDGHVHHRLDGGHELVVAGEERGSALRGDALDVAAAALDEQDERDQVLAGELLGEPADVAALDALREVLGGAAADGEVLAAYRDVATVDLAEAHDIRRGRELLELAVLVEPRAGERADLVEGAVVEQDVEAFADRVLAAVVLALDAVRLAAGARQLGALPDLVDPVLPDHRAAPPRPCALGGWWEGSASGEGACGYSMVGRSSGLAGSWMSMAMSAPSTSTTVA